MSFEIGDRVIDIRYGEGEVTKVMDRIYVTFPCDNKLRFYNNDGRDSSKAYLPSLYHKEGFVPPSAPEPHRCPFKEGDLVLVRDDPNYRWHCHIFKTYSNNAPREQYYRCKNDASYKYCLPFKGNEHLLDTCDEPGE